FLPSCALPSPGGTGRIPSRAPPPGCPCPYPGHWLRHYPPRLSASPRFRLPRPSISLHSTPGCPRHSTKDPCPTPPLTHPGHRTDRCRIHPDASGTPASLHGSVHPAGQTPTSPYTTDGRTC